MYLHITRMDWHLRKTVHYLIWKFGNNAKNWEAFVMLKLWKASTFMLSIQLIVFVFSYMASGYVFLSVLVAAVATFILTYFFNSTAQVGVAATCGATAFAFSLNSNNVMAVTACVVAGASVAYAASVIKDNNPFWQRVLCAMPQGMGTIFGGMLILWNRSQKKSSQAS